MARHPAMRGILFLSVLTLGGCTLKAKNLKPASPYNFSQISTMATLAQAAYADDLSIRALCRPFYNDVYIQVIASTNNKYFLATSTTTRTQLISIAGTSNIENVLLDADQTQTYSPELAIALHRGFARAARLIYDDVKPRLLSGYQVRLTGHSLGGAEALIVGMLLKSAGTPPESIVTFGQPKVTTQAGVDAFKELPLTRVVNQNDIIPTLPLEPYRYSAPELVLFSGTTYSLIKERPFNPVEVLAAWQALQRHQAPMELPQHYIANYLINLNSKLADSQVIPYPNALLPR